MDVAALPSWINTFKISNRNRNVSHVNESSFQDSNITNFLDKISYVSKTYVLIFMDSLDSLNGSLELNVQRKIRQTLDFLARGRADEEEFVLVDMRKDDSLRPLVTVRLNYSEYVVDEISDNLEEWSAKHKHYECESCESEFAKLLSVLIILLCSSVFVAVLFGIAALARYQLLKKRITKGPYKVLLTATDFVFPQIADSRRVSNVKHIQLLFFILLFFFYFTLFPKMLFH